MTVRARRREEKTERMLDLATAIVARDGIEALTMHRLANELGVAVGGLYRYFPSRETLVVHLQRRAVGALADEIAAVLDRPFVAGDAPGALRRLVRVARTWREQAKTAPERHRLIDAYLSDPRTLLSDEQAEQLEAVIAPLLSRVAGAFEDARAAGALDEGDARLRTAVLWAVVHGVDHFNKRDSRTPVKLRSDALFSEAIRTLLQGWGAQRPVVAAALKRR